MGSSLYEGIAECHDGACTCVPGRHVNCDGDCVKNANDSGGACEHDIIRCSTTDYSKRICFAGALNSLAVACSVDYGCTCVLMVEEQCANRCIDLPDGSGQCE
ncbi:MAG: hypothetical protein JXP73_09675 [Deltaproteobacteria bacterium]|nr:hypothetical protein [Deltaproteobacteria bacterium]